MSKSWFHTLKKAAKLRPSSEEISTTSLALIKKANIDEEKKKQMLEAYPLARHLL
ncbi:MAG: hypothetical protein QW463_05880 [Candidatus Caldarchaeum sp.]